MRTRPLSNRSSVGATLTAFALALGALTIHPSIASADETSVSPTGKGVVGGALLGAEAVTIVESLAGAHAPWAYGVGAVLGGIGGGIGGRFVETNSNDGRAPVYMLAVGVGLVIPALVVSLNAMRYRPNETVTEDHAPTNAPPANPGSPSGSAVISAGAGPAPAYPSPPPAGAPAAAPAPAPPPAAPPPTTTPAPAGGGTAPPLSLFEMSHGSMSLGVPVPEVRPLYSMGELRQYGMAQQTEVRMPLVKIAF